MRLTQFNCEPGQVNPGTGQPSDIGRQTSVSGSRGDVGLEARCRHIVAIRSNSCPLSRRVEGQLLRQSMHGEWNQWLGCPCVCHIHTRELSACDASAAEDNTPVPAGEGAAVV